MVRCCRYCMAGAKPFSRGKMRYHLVTVGQLSRGFYAEGCAFYAKRLERFAKLEQTHLKEARAKDPNRVKELESTALLNAASGHLIILDEKGKTHTSRKLAERISDLELRGVSSVSLLLGGAEGHSDTLKAKADEAWSLSKLTLPHELARLVLLEQLYRAETIRAGHPYHRD